MKNPLRVVLACAGDLLRGSKCEHESGEWWEAYCVHAQPRTRDGESGRSPGADATSDIEIVDVLKQFRISGGRAGRRGNVASVEPTSRTQGKLVHGRGYKGVAARQSCGWVCTRDASVGCWRYFFASATTLGSFHTEPSARSACATSSHFRGSGGASSVPREDGQPSGGFFSSVRF